MLFGFIQDLIPLLVFVGIVGGIFAVLSMISNRNSKAMDRLARISRPQSLSELEEAGKQKNDRFQGILDTAKALSKPMMPQTELEQSELRIRLANAGFRSDAAPKQQCAINRNSKSWKGEDAELLDTWDASCASTHCMLRSKGGHRCRLLRRIRGACRDAKSLGGASRGGRAGRQARTRLRSSAALRIFSA